MHDSATSSLKAPGKKARHACIECGPSTDMYVDMARTDLDGPGIGLCNNGRRVLVLQGMHIIDGPMDSRGPQHEVELHLIGNMEWCAWPLGGVELGESTPAYSRYGECLRVILHDDTMMAHPMHMRRIWGELGAPDGTLLAHRHTIPVQSTQRTSFLVMADALG